VKEGSAGREEGRGRKEGLKDVKEGSEGRKGRK
jgi:hypothetical protein